jgi:hypothetical protein
VATTLAAPRHGIGRMHPHVTTPSVTRSSARRWSRIVMVLLALGAAVWFAGRELPSWSVLTAAFGRVDLPLLGVALVVATFSLWLFTRQQQVLFTGFGIRVPVVPAVAITYSRSAMSMTFPAGPVVSAVFAIEQFRRFGASRSTTATAGERHHPVAPRLPLGRVATLVRARLADVATLPGRYWAAGIGYRLLSCWLVIPGRPRRLVRAHQDLPRAGPRIGLSACPGRPPRTTPPPAPRWPAPAARC